MSTREEFIHSARTVCLRHAAITEAERTHLASLKLVYGAGFGTGARGITYFKAWKNGDPQAREGELIEICAFGEESLVQLAGTTIHELAHALAGVGAGHSGAWKEACARLGLRAVKAAGTTYRAAMFAPVVRAELAVLPVPTDGHVTGWSNAAPAPSAAPFKPRPCSQGIGTRGGRSRGTGSGSRLRRHVCGCGVIVRAARDVLAAHCDLCGSAFTRG